MLVVSVTSAVVACGAMAPSRAGAQASGSEPGATDPVGSPQRYYQFRDDELWAPFSAGTTFLDGALFSPSGSLSVGSENDMSFGNQQTTQFVSAARGRVTTQGNDQIAAVVPDGSGNVDVTLWDPSQGTGTQAENAALSTRLPGFVAAPNGFNPLLDVAVGDLDKLPDASGAYHDEVAVVYQSSASALTLAVLDYTTSGGTYAPDAQVTQTLPKPVSLSQVPGIDTTVATAVGDFDGDGVDEIAVAYLTSASNLEIDVFSYANQGNGKLQLTLADTLDEAPQGGKYYAGSIDLAAGDWDGNGVDDLVAAYVPYTPSGSGYKATHAEYIIESAANSAGQPQLSLGSANVSDSGTFSNAGQLPKVQVASGLFEYSPNPTTPADNYDFGRDEFAMAHNDADSSLEIDTFAVSSDFQTLTQIFSGGGNVSVTNPSSGRQAWSIAAGNFIGVADTDSATYQIAYFTNDLSAGGKNVVGLVDVPSGKVASTATLGYGNFGPHRMPVVAWDLDGNSLFLGAPVHIYAPSVYRTDVIMQEPPKHAYYDNNPSSSTYGQIVDVSRYDDFAYTLTSSNSTSDTYSKSSASSTTLGGSVSATASLTVGADEDLGIAAADSQFSTSITSSTSYSNTHTTNSLNSSYNSSTVAFSCATSEDDCVVGSETDLDIWRYRIYGAPQAAGAQGENGFLDIVVPGPTVQQPAGSGLAVSGYQPAHENGNILSYPLPTSSGGVSSFAPTDQGSFLYNGKPVTVNGQSTGVMTAPTQFTYGGTTGTQTLTFTYGTSTSTSRTTSSQLTNSEDVKTSVKAKVSLEGDNASAGFSATVGFNGAWSWSSSSTSTSTSSSSESLGLNVPPAQAGLNLAYPFYPLAYVTGDGTTKVAAAVDVTGDSATAPNWKSIYGALPDPALNLPYRYVPYVNPGSNQVTAYQLNFDPGGKTDHSAEQLRGFALLDPGSSAHTPIPGDSPTTGQQALASVQVLNYSTGQPVNNLGVQFQLIGYDDDTGQELPFTSCPGGSPPTALGRCVVASATVDSLDALGQGTAQAIWDTTSWGSGGTCTPTYYRMYVVLDPANAIQETYDTQNTATSYPYFDPNSAQTRQLQGIFPGQNNEGWSEVSVTQPSNNGGDCGLGTSADISLGGAVEDPRATATSAKRRRHTLPRTTKRLRLGRPAYLRFDVRSNYRHHGARTLLIYDRNPRRKGVRLLARRVVLPARSHHYVRVQWIPRRAGRFTFYARVLPIRRERSRSNNVTKVSVTVVRK
jgi:hypothetical protein